MIRAILYDLDGVLVHACEWHYNSLNAALKSVCEFEISRNDHLTVYNGLTTRSKLDMLIKQGMISATDAKKVWELKQTFTTREIIRYAQPYAEKIELHEYTRSQGLMSACVTNSIRETATMMLDRTWQLQYMKILICNEDSTPKPSPAPYILAMERLRLYPHECIIVEDSDKGIEAAIASKAKVVKVDGCYQVNKVLIETNLR